MMAAPHFHAIEDEGMKLYRWGRLLLIVAALAAAGCGQIFSREDLTTAVMGKSEQEVNQQLGKPDAVDDRNPEHVTWTYNHKTFDLGNQNKVDSKTMLLFEGGRGSASRHVTKVDFAS
jgi:hypothetical protein